jgi:hypothetical protein
MVINDDFAKFFKRVYFVKTIRTEDTGHCNWKTFTKVLH